MKLQYWVIYHTPSQTFMPARVRATQYDFDRLRVVHEPRLFNTERAAKNCATCWAQGEWHAEVTTERESWELPTEYTVQNPPAPMIKVESRRREDLQILPATLKIG